jgi:hypothetical protein
MLLGIKPVLSNKLFGNIGTSPLAAKLEFTLPKKTGNDTIKAIKIVLLIQTSVKNFRLRYRRQHLDKPEFKTEHYIMFIFNN